MRGFVVALSLALLIAGCGGGEGETSAIETETQVSGDGTFVVGTDIEPGTWRSAGPQDGRRCVWHRVSTLDGADIADNTDPDGPQTVQILAGDTAFETEGCQPWSKVG